MIVSCSHRLKQPDPHLAIIQSLSFFPPVGFLQAVGTVRHGHGKSPTEAASHIRSIEDTRSDLKERDGARQEDWEAVEVRPLELHCAALDEDEKSKDLQAEWMFYYYFDF